MKRKNVFKLIVAVVLCLAAVLPYVSIPAEAEIDNYAGAQFALGTDKVTFSILGDSISTYEGVSNNTSYNSTIGGNAVYYNGNNYGIVRADTWWQQAIDTLGMELCVNNAWSGSEVVGNRTQAAWKTRCTQLHNASNVNPNIIAVYMGTNDIKSIDHELVTLNDQQNAMLTEAKGSAYDCTYEFSYYVRMIQRMIAAYGNAEIYLFTLLPNENLTQISGNAMKQWNQSIRELAAYYQNQGNAVYVVDLYNDSGITSELSSLNLNMVNTLHPNDAGMDAITNCFVSAVLSKSRFFNNGDFAKVQYDLEDVYVVNGNANVAFLNGDDTTGMYPFQVSLLPTEEAYDMDVKVEWYNKGTDYNSNGSWGWYDITSWAYSGGTIAIPGVQYSKSKIALKITAKAVYETKNYRWEWKDGVLESCVPDGKDYQVVGGIDYNDTTVMATDGVNEGTGYWNNGSNLGTYFKLSDSIVLRNNEPWVIEWQDTGYVGYGSTWMSENEGYSDRNDTYFWRGSHNNGSNATTDDNVLGFGYYNEYSSVKQHITFGVCLGPDANTKTETTYRMVNVINDDGTNMVYLYRNGVEVGAMNNKYYGSNPQNTTDNWISGRDFVFDYFGSVDKLLRSCRINYLQIWEGGDFDTLRLEQLLEEADEILPQVADLLIENGQMQRVDGVLQDASGNVVNADYSNSSRKQVTYYAAYLKAAEAARNYVKGKDNAQNVYDAFASNLITARNMLYIYDTDKYSHRFLSVEMVTESAYAGKQVGVNVITDPDVYTLQVVDANGETVPMAFCSGKLQYMKIGGKEQLVKVWFVGFTAPAQGSYNWTIKANGSSAYTPGTLEFEVI